MKYMWLKISVSPEKKKMDFFFSNFPQGLKVFPNLFPCVYKQEELYYLCSKYKATDQLCSYYTADLHLCFCIGKIQFSYDVAQ